MASQPHQAQGPWTRETQALRGWVQSEISGARVCQARPVLSLTSGSGLDGRRGTAALTDSRRVSSSPPVSAVASAVMPRAAPRCWGPPSSAQPGEPPAPHSYVGVENQRLCGLFRRSQEQGRRGEPFRHRPDPAAYGHSRALGPSVSPPDTGVALMPASQGYCEK